MDEPKRGRAKPQKLRVTFPDGTIYCYSSVKETFLATLRKIGADKLSQVELNVCRLPMFSETVYKRYKDFMEPVGDGLYANVQGNTYNKYAQLHIISDQLNLGLQIDLGNDFSFERVSRGSKGMAVLEVKFPDGTVIGEQNTLETFTQCIWQIGIESVRRLNLKHNGKDLITTSQKYDGQVQIDVDRWLVVPGQLKDKVKILKVINVLLHVNMEITSFSSSDGNSYKRIGNVDRNKDSRDADEFLGAKFKKGDKVNFETYGEGKVIEYFANTKTYKVQFYVIFRNKPFAEQIRIVNENDMKLSEVSHKYRKYEPIHVVTHEEYIKKKQVVPERPVEIKYKVGSKVFHKKYGEGIVYGFNSKDRTYRVRFPKIFVNLPAKNQVLIIGEKFLEPVNVQIKNEPSKKGRKAKEDETFEPKFSIGTMVRNKKFGQGKVIAVYEGTRTYKVHFDDLEDQDVYNPTRVVDEKDLALIEGNGIPLPSENSRLGNDDKHKGQDNVITGRFKVGDKVYNKVYGKGIVQEYFPKIRDYKVRFYEKYSRLAPKNQSILIHERFLEPLIEEAEMPVDMKSKKANHVDVKESDIEQKRNKFSIGDKVFHSKYGRGKILESIPNSHVYKVLFPFYNKEGLNDNDGQIPINEEDLVPLTYQIVERLVEISKKGETSPNHKGDDEEIDEEGEFHIGDRVYCENYGEGVIKKYYKYSKTYDVKLDYGIDNKRVFNFKENDIILADNEDF